MKELMRLWFLLAVGVFSVESGWAQGATNAYAEFGQLLLLHLPTAPFPHPARAEGHKYQNQNFSAAEHYQDDTVGVFIPKGFKAEGKVDFMIHFHGWRNHVENVLSHYQLIQQFVESGRNAILVVPQGPYEAPDSFGGKLEDPRGFERFMKSVLDSLEQQKILQQPTLGSVALSGHSGGYHVIAAILDHGGLTDHIREVWLFDGLYGGTDKYLAWFEGATNRRFIDIYTEHGGTKEETEKLLADRKARHSPLLEKPEAKITDTDLRENRLIFSYTTMEHDEVPHLHHTFAQYLKTSCLKSR